MAGTGELVVQGIVALGGTGVLAAIANAMLSRSKTKTDTEQGRADAAKVLAEGAAVLVEPLRNQVQLLHVEVTRLRGRENRMYRLLRIHGAWDVRVAQQLIDSGIHVDPPPPLELAEDAEQQP